MKITFLGTAAAEGFPAVFCNCMHCQQARKLGGKNIRTRSQTLINDDLLVDLPADTYYHFLQNNILGDRIKYVLITHSHQDHFYPEELTLRHKPYAHEMTVPTLNLLCNKGSAEKLSKKYPTLPQSIELNILAPYKTANFGDYQITPLPARHNLGDEALIYIIKSDKTLLYAHDTGFFFDEVFDYVKNNGIVFDIISFDCTNVDIPAKDDGSHMDISHIEKSTKIFCDMGAVTKNTVKVLNHFSHNGNPLQHLLENRASSLGYLVSYDGMTVNI